MAGQDEGISTKVSVLGDKEYKSALQDIARQLTVLNTGMKASESAFGDQAGSMEALQGKLKSLQEIYDAHKEKVRLVAEQLNKAKDEYGENSKQADNLQIALNRAQTAMNKVGTEITDTEASLQKMDTAMGDGTESGEALEDAMGGVEKAAKDQGKEAGSAAKETKSFGESLGEAAKKAASFTLEAVAAAYAAVSAAAAAAGKAVLDSLDVYASFDDGMLQVQATMGLVAGSSEEADTSIAKLTTAAQEAGASTKFTARDAADALNYLALAGYDADRATATLPKVLNLAAAGGMDLAKASDMVTDSMSALGLTDIDGYLDSMAKTSQKSNTNVELLGEGILKLGATGREMKGGINEINLVLGLLADNGIKGAEGGTHLRNMILSLSTPTDTAAKAIEELGLKVFDAQGNMRAMPDILQDLNGKMEGMSSQEKMDLISTIFNKTDIAAVNALLGTSAERWEDLAGEIENSQGACEQMATTMESGLGGSIRSFHSAVEGLQIAVGSIFSDMAQGMVDDTTAMIRDITSILQDGFQPEDVAAISETLTSYIDTQLTKIIGLIGDAMPLVTEALGTVVTTLTEQLPGLAEKLLPAAFGLLQSVLDAVVENVEPLTALAVDLVTQLATFLLENVDKLLEGAVGIVTGLVDGITEKLPELIPLAVEMMVSLAVALVEALPNLIEKLPEIVTAIVNGLKEVDWAQLGLDLINGLVNGLTAAVSALLDSIKAIFTTIWDGIKSVFGINSPSTVAAEAGGFILDGLLEGFANAVDAVVTKVKEIFGKIWDAIKSIFGFGKGESEESKEAKEAGKDIMTGMQKGIEGNQDTLEGVVRNVSQAVLNTFKTELGIEGATSSKTKPFGEAAAVGLNDGLNAKGVAGTFQGGANTAASGMDSALKTAFGVSGGVFSGTSASKFTYIGEAVAAGIAKGIKDGSDKITTAAKEAADAAYKAAKDKLGIKSPSTRMREIGLFYDEGFAEGIDAGMGRVLRSARLLSSLAADETRGGSEGLAGSGGGSGFEVDYTKLGDAVADSFIRKGLGNTDVYLDKRLVSQELEPGVSKATQRRANQSAAGRSSRMVFA